MRITIEIHNSKTNKKYYITKWDNQIRIENSEEEGMVVTEEQLF